MKTALTTMIAALAIVCGPVSLSAEDGFVAQGSVTTAVSLGEVGVAVSAGAGYQVGPWRFTGEVTHAPKLPPDFFHILGMDSWTDATTFIGNVRADLPRVGRVSPFVLGGLGAAWITDAFGVVYATGILPGPPIVESSSERPALTVGGGVSVPLGTRISVDIDLRLLRLGFDEGRSVGRLGGGLSYHF